MQNTQLVAEAAIGGDPKGKTPPKIDNNVRSAWNQYVQFLDSKGLKGSPVLDHNDMGGKMIDEYRKENPDTPITREMVAPIQQEFAKYRQYMLDQIAQGKGQFGPGVNKDNFMRSLSVVDGVPGQRTTSFQFPQGYLNYMGKTENKGFMTADKPVADQITGNLQ